MDANYFVVFSGVLGIALMVAIVEIFRLRGKNELLRKHNERLAESLALRDLCDR